MSVWRDGMRPFGLIRVRPRMLFSRSNLGRFGER